MNLNSEPLVIENLSLGYRRKPLFQNLSLKVSRGEFVTLMGENGVGKTSLITCLMGQLEPLKGEVRFWGQRNRGSQRKSIQESVGWVLAERESFAPWLSLRWITQTLKKFYPNWNEELFQSLAEEFRLDLDSKVGTLSSGEASKFRLLKVMAFEPRLLILDELTANLSPESKAVITSLLIERFSQAPCFRVVVV